MVDIVICELCGRGVTARIHKGGDGSLVVPLRHKNSHGEWCGEQHYTNAHELAVAARHLTCMELQAAIQRALDFARDEERDKALVALKEVDAAVKLALDALRKRTPADSGGRKVR